MQGLARQAVLFGAARVTPLSILGADLKVWFDNQALSTMWRDTAATVPAVKDERVARQFCRVNPANYRQQATSTQQPVLRQNSVTGAYYLEPDGEDDGLVMPALDLSAFNKIASFTAIRKLSDAARAIPVADGPGNIPGFYIAAPDTGLGANSLSFLNAGTAAAVATTAAFPAPVTAVIATVGSIPDDISQLWVNGSLAASASTDLGSGNYTVRDMYFFRRNGSVPFGGHEYGFSLSAGAIPTTNQIRAMSQYYNALCGAY